MMLLLVSYIPPLLIHRCRHLEYQTDININDNCVIALDDKQAGAKFKTAKKSKSQRNRDSVDNVSIVVITGVITIAGVFVFDCHVNTSHSPAK